MNCKVLVVLCLVLTLLLPATEGGWGRRRRRRRRVCRPHCPLKCYGYVCTTNSYGVYCYKICRRQCTTVCYGKRDAGVDISVHKANDDTPLNDATMKAKMIPLPLPDKFSDYDTSKDKRISFVEFKKALPHVTDDVIRRGFGFIDKNGDSYIDCQEFLRSNLNVPKAETC